MALLIHVSLVGLTTSSATNNADDACLEISENTLWNIMHILKTGSIIMEYYAYEQKQNKIE